MRAPDGGPRLKPLLALVAGGLLLALCGCGLSERPPHSAEVDAAARQRVARQEPTPRAEPPAEVATTVAKRTAKLARHFEPFKPPHRHHVAPPAESPSLPEAGAGGGPSTPLPPASVGNNGSYVPPASNKQITPGNTGALERREEQGLAISFNGIALASPSAPKSIKAAISAANELVGLPYIWGGGHASWYASGYDCSGAVSYALAGGGFLAAPLTSVGLESWGAPGPGRWLTVYANSEHTFTVIDGLRFDTVGDARGSGPRWHPLLADTQGFVARHPPGF